MIIFGLKYRSSHHRVQSMHDACCITKTRNTWFTHLKFIWLSVSENPESIKMLASRSESKTQVTESFGSTVVLFWHLVVLSCPRTMYLGISFGSTSLCWLRDFTCLQIDVPFHSHLYIPRIEEHMGRRYGCLKSQLIY